MTYFQQDLTAELFKPVSSYMILQFQAIIKRNWRAITKN